MTKRSRYARAFGNGSNAGPLRELSDGDLIEGMRLLAEAVAELEKRIEELEARAGITRPRASWFARVLRFLGLAR